MLFDNSIEYPRKVIILLWLLKMQVLHKVTASASAESSSEEEKGDVMTSPHRQTSALRIFTPAPSPLTGKTIMTGRKKSPADPPRQRSCDDEKQISL